MSILVIAEHDNLSLNISTQHVVSAALQIGADIDLLVAGFNCQSVATIASKLAKVNKILLADNSSYQHQLAENIAALIQTIASDYTHIVTPATTFGKNILPRAAALLNVGQISEVIQIINQDTFVRPIYAGNALATVQSTDPIKFMTVRTTAFDICANVSEPCPIVALNTVCDLQLSKFVKLEATAHTERPELTAARIVVAGGRGLQNKENFKMLEDLANKLNAAIGASRAAVDAGFVPNDYQIGQTGKVVAPELYIAVGISGAIQHLAGMKDSKVIVAINKDPDAPIFQVADYGIVGDLFTIVPELITALKVS